VASLGLVSPGAANDGVAPIFSSEKLTTFLVIAVCKFDDDLQVSPPGGCHPRGGPPSPWWRHWF